MYICTYINGVQWNGFLSQLLLLLCQGSTRRLSLMLVANLALTDTLLPLSTSLTTAMLIPRDVAIISDHSDRSFTCRLAQAVFTTLMLVALLALGKTNIED